MLIVRILSLFLLVSLATQVSAQDNQVNQATMVEMDAADLTVNSGLLPTTYFVAQEENVPCSGRYRTRDFNGTEVADVLTPSGAVIATVCERFLQVLKMEGTGILKDRGLGRITVNWAGDGRFLPVDLCRMGLGVKGLCLLPYYTLATDLVAYPAGTMLYMPRARGVLLPDGSLHQGFFLVRDTGGAFHGIGKKRVDMFVGLEVDGDNAFSRVGFHHRNEEQSFVVTGESKQRARLFLKNNFGELFNDFKE